MQNQFGRQPRQPLLGAPIMLAKGLQEPFYTLVRKFDGIEIRRYAPYVVAEVLMDCPAKKAGNQAFPILAGYIFGNNKAAKKFAMTAPVIQTPAPGGFLVQFVLPRELGLSSAPEPLDSGVALQKMPARRVAVIVFSGLWSDANYAIHLARLKDALDTAGLAWRGEPVYARYNPPYTLWFLRRNEIWLDLTKN